ncbi:MAG: 2'-5' RNA ligase family protein [Deinococcus sp.]|uniref:2'-5' RNA ligase family protein n=1 Tax=Deinococcus sp. TaxID=47478 RepID=UPI0026DD2562|nr:2'-5' RNA ligase family protein [Deinococcus sp.]MDO4246009.1 2'-5' RNA ligase family protein [Deinococcus sp.]
MTPSFLLSLLPPPELSARLGNFRDRHGIRDAAAVPHITVKARSGLDGSAGEVARAVASGQAPVRVEVGGPRLFPKGSALYLTVHSPEAIRLHLALLDALKPPRRFGYEGPQMTPHLTLALARRGVDLPELLTDAEREFADLKGTPFVFTARTLTLMEKPGPGGVYIPVAEWPLSGGVSD